jgi:hypothetical protein
MPEARSRVAVVGTFPAAETIDLSSRKIVEPDAQPRSKGGRT